MRTDEVITRISTVDTFAALVGDEEPARAYRRLARMVHPDAVGPRGAAAFARLTELWRAHGSIRTTRQRYATRDLAYRGDLANLYAVDLVDGGTGHLKLARDPSCNDLLAREAVALRTLAGEADPRYLPYLPRLVESFRHRDTAGGSRGSGRARAVEGAARRGNVIATTATGLVGLDEVRRRRPAGLDPRDAAWMWRRLLVALGTVHRAGLIHGALVAEHVLIQPDDHGLVLVDWCYSVPRGGDRITAIVPAHRDRYPAEVLARQEPGPGTDLAMAAGLMAELMGDRAPKPLRAFAAGCRQTNLRHRPDDAWRLLSELDDLLYRLYGPRTFRPFHL